MEEPNCVIYRQFTFSSSPYVLLGMKLQFYNIKNYYKKYHVFQWYCILQLCYITKYEFILALHGFKGFISQLWFDFIGKGLIYNVPISKHSFGEYKSLTIFEKVLKWFDVRLKLLLHFEMHFFYEKIISLGDYENMGWSFAMVLTWNNVQF